MMPLAGDPQILAFTLVAAALTVTPGADTLLVLRNVLRGSRTDGLVTTLGICSGLFVHALLSALGVSVILMHSAALFYWVKALGALYLMWLGWQSLRQAIKQPADLHIQDTPAGAPVPTRNCFLEGFLTNILNPKVAVFYLAFLPQFIGPDDPVVIKSTALAGIHYLLSIIWLGFLSVFLDRMRQWIIHSGVRRWLDGVCGTLLMALGIRLALESR
ncbi:MAG: LysE family translocator [Thermodesulfobacteriota bacterium]